MISVRDDMSCGSWVGESQANSFRESVKRSGGVYPPIDSPQDQSPDALARAERREEGRQQATTPGLLLRAELS